MANREAVLVAGVRTPIATAYKGSLVDVDAMTLATHVVSEVVKRSGIPVEDFDDIHFGESLYGGGALGRYAAVAAGLVDVPGVAENRHCATGLATVSSAAASIMAGMDRVIIAGGVQSSSTMPVSRWKVPGTQEEWVEEWLAPSHPNTPEAPIDDMTITVGWNTAVKKGVTREEMDAWAFRSHMRAIAGIDAGAFKDEIVPIEVTRRDTGERLAFDTDEHPRRSTSMEKLASLKPLHPEIEGFSITAGNSAGVNDGAIAMVITDREYAEANGLPVLATVKSWASVGLPPAESGLGPIKAIPKALARAGITKDDVDLWEINEAFASVSVAAAKEFELDEEVVNVLGSGCSLGHPIAMTGGRMVLTLAHEMRRRGGGTAVASMCIGGGMGSAVVLEVPGA